MRKVRTISGENPSELEVNINNYLKRTGVEIISLSVTFDPKSFMYKYDAFLLIEDGRDE